MLGYVHFDRSGIGNERTEILVDADRIPSLIRNKYVRITPAHQGPVFFGRIVEGPFFHPEEVSRDSALAQTSILKGESFPSIPNYYAVGGIEILGILRDGRVVGCNTRPAPQAVVDFISPEDVYSLLNIQGDLLLGELDGYPKIQVRLRSDDKKVVPRNIGVFGTVGSGKTNTSQTLIEEASKAGYAVVVVDVEGEYIDMDLPSTEAHLHNRLESYGIGPQGLDNFHVYYPQAGESDKDGANSFTIRVADLDPMVLSEIIEPTEAQERRLLDVIDELLKKHDRERADRARQSGEALPGLGSLAPGSGGTEVPYTLGSLIGAVREKAEETRGADRNSYFALMGKLGRLNRTRAFDVKGVPFINPGELLQGGRVSVFDVSYSSDILKNLVIADVLRKVFDYKINHSDAPKTIIVIEEAHTFISREKRGRMEETIEMLREISRRGRKRWLGLCFVSQQPSHLPPEIFELCNTRIVHNVRGLENLRALKLTAGDVSEEMWNSVPSLGIGQAVLSTPQLRDPVVVNVRPSATRRRFIE